MSARTCLVPLFLATLSAGSAYAQSPRTTARSTYRTEARATPDEDVATNVRYRVYRKSGAIIGVVSYRETSTVYTAQLPDGRATTFAKSAVDRIEELTDEEIAEMKAAAREAKEEPDAEEKTQAQARDRQRQKEIELLEAKARADRAATARLEAEAKAKKADASSRPSSSQSSSSGAASGSPRTDYRSTARTSSSSSSNSGTVNVRGYYRKDGTYVSPHTRSAPRR